MKSKHMIGFQWRDTLTQAVQNLPHWVQEGLRHTVQHATHALKTKAQEKTPVRSGRARAGWVARLGAGGQTGEVRNDVPYAAELERGHSQQAPNGVLGPALRETEPTLRAELSQRVREALRRTK